MYDVRRVTVCGGKFRAIMRGPGIGEGQREDCHFTVLLSRGKFTDQCGDQYEAELRSGMMCDSRIGIRTGFGADCIDLGMEIGFFAGMEMICWYGIAKLVDVGSTGSLRHSLEDWT